jgi:hypothetical protein
MTAPGQIQTTPHVRDGGSFSRKQPCRSYRAISVECSELERRLGALPEPVTPR